MDQIRNFGDDRQVARCAYCGHGTLTRDHVPSRVLLDKPYPANLPVVSACQKCNQGFSADEEYVACLIDCVVAGSAAPADVKRDKIRQILSRKPALTARLAKARRQTDESTHFLIEEQRVRNVLLKLGRGHALYELNEPQIDEPSSFTYAALPSLSIDLRTRFERAPESAIWPEVGSRAMQRLASGGSIYPQWIIAQPGQYRYLAYVCDAVVVRTVLSEYLACEIVWRTC